MDNKENIKLNNQEEMSSEIKNQEANNSDNIEKKSNDNNTVVENHIDENEEIAKTTDYTSLSKEELVATLKRLIENEPVNKIKNDIEVIKTNFYKKLHADIEDKKRKFIEAGGEEDAFSYIDTTEENLKGYLQQYKENRAKYLAELEKEKQENLKLKYEVIESIKNLVHREESVNKTFQEFRDLQKRWNEIGLVPQNAIKDLWETYNHHVDNFYSYIKINKELRDLDLKKNLDTKIEFCEKAEELLLHDDVVYAFKELQKLHDRWREVGPVPNEKREEIWERFKQVTGKINKKHQEYYDELKKQQEQNLLAKQTICENIEQLNEQIFTSHKDWEEKTKEVLEQQKLWNTIGPVPRKDNNAIYQRLRAACNIFFDRKKEFYAQLKDEQENNLQLKIDLCIQAEALQDSSEWKKTTEDFLNLQKKWKTIGPVPKKDSNNVWKRFRAACDMFFNRKAEFFAQKADNEEENLRKKKELIEKITAYQPSEEADKNLNKLKEFQKEWAEIGHVSIKQKDKLQTDYRNAINNLFDKLEIDDYKREILKFKIKTESFIKQRNPKNKIREEKESLSKQLKKIENDIYTLENNIGFFSNSANAEAIIKEMNIKINSGKEKIKIIKSKLDILGKIKLDEK